MTNDIDSEEVEKRIQNSENSKVDFKKEWYSDTSKNNDEIVKDFIALANGNVFCIGQDAYLIVGVKEKESGEKELFDISLSQDLCLLKKQILQNLKNAVDPPVQEFYIEYVEVRNKNLLVIKIPQHPYLMELKKGLYKNYYRKGDILYRSGESTEIATYDVASKHKLKIEKYNNIPPEALASFRGSERSNKKPERISTSYTGAKKICVINTSPDVGKTAITAGILRPKHPNSKILQIFGQNHFLRAANSSAMHIKEIPEILQMVIDESELIVDVGGVTTYDFFGALAEYEGTANDFDRYVVPIKSSRYFHEKTIYTIKSLLDLGVPTNKMRIIFNMDDSYSNNIAEDFSETIDEFNKLGVYFDLSIVIPKAKAYFDGLSNPSQKEPFEDIQFPERYSLLENGTNGSILHQRARASLADCFTKIDEYIYG